MSKPVTERLQSAINGMDVMLEIETELSAPTRRLVHSVRKELLLAYAALDNESENQYDYIADGITLHQVSAFALAHGISTVCLHPGELESIIDAMRDDRTRRVYI